MPSDTPSDMPPSAPPLTPPSVPRLVLSALQPPPAHASLEDKLGGVPDGLPPHRWPHCSECDAPMALLAQLAHHPERLDLGRTGRVLYVFQCDDSGGECPTWERERGANAALVLEGAELVQGPTPPPEGAPRLAEARVLGWRALPPGAQGVEAETRAGGAPHFLQGPEEAPPAPWRFVAQLGSLHRFEGPVPRADAVGCTVTRRVGGEYVQEQPASPKPGAPAGGLSVDGEGRWSCQAANFGDAGVGYVYVRTDGPRPEACFFWQCH